MYHKKISHNLLLLVPRGFQLVASLNHLAISEDEHKIHTLTHTVSFQGLHKEAMLLTSIIALLNKQ